MLLVFLYYGGDSDGVSFSFSLNQEVATLDFHHLLGYLTRPRDHHSHPLKRNSDQH